MTRWEALAFYSALSGLILIATLGLWVPAL